MHPVIVCVYWKITSGPHYPYFNPKLDSGEFCTSTKIVSCTIYGLNGKMITFPLQTGKNTDVLHEIGAKNQYCIFVSQWLCINTAKLGKLLDTDTIIPNKRATSFQINTTYTLHSLGWMVLSTLFSPVIVCVRFVVSHSLGSLFINTHAHLSAGVVDGNFKGGELTDIKYWIELNRIF